jgi:hypothetical protein
MLVEAAGFAGWERLLWHVDEAMSWETVRDLRRMRPLIVLIRNLAIQSQVPQAIWDEIETIAELLDEILLDAIK